MPDNGTLDSLYKELNAHKIIYRKKLLWMIAKTGVSLVQLSKEIGIAPNTLRDFLNKEHDISPTRLIKIRIYIEKHPEVKPFEPMIIRKT